MAPSRYTIAAAAGAALLAAAPARAAPTTIGVTLNFKARAHTVATPFLAYNIDTGSIYNGFDFTEPKLIALIAQLGPTILRIGGTAADYAYYVPDATTPTDGATHTIINNRVLDDIVALATKANVQVLFDFNSLEFRDHKGQWDPAGNATATLQYLESKYAGQIDFAWSTGNEPDLWPGTHYSGEELAAGARAGRAGGAQCRRPWARARAAHRPRTIRTRETLTHPPPHPPPPQTPTRSPPPWRAIASARPRTALRMRVSLRTPRPSCAPRGRASRA